ncbi:ATP synthase subunit I [Arenibacter certesii]|nr:ATP synthase subunit I [Arenibacter certesii]
MNDVIIVIPALFAGIVLGVVFFGGLWYTVRVGLRSSKAGLIFTGSLILRMLIILLGFYYIGANSWQKMLACLVGFLIARVVITRYTHKQKSLETPIINQMSDET